MLELAVRALDRFYSAATCMKKNSICSLIVTWHYAVIVLSYYVILHLALGPYLGVVRLQV